jgi:hypothetical protein
MERVDMHLQEISQLYDISSCQYVNYYFLYNSYNIKIMCTIVYRQSVNLSVYIYP